jgi:MFS family permease
MQPSAPTVSGAIPPSSAPLDSPPGGSHCHPLRLPEFRILWAGALLSALGDQFYVVALPWLVLQLTGSSLALGAVLMAGGLPRSLFMLAGGMVGDRVSPRRLLLLTSLLRFALVGLTGLLICANQVRIAHIYALALAFGLASAFSIPAWHALLPSLVTTVQLPAANSAMTAGLQISSIAGSALAGLAVKRWGTGPALLVDAVSFLFYIVALAWLSAERAPVSSSSEWRGAKHAVAETWRHIQAKPVAPRLMFLVGSLYFCLLGPMQIGLPTICSLRFHSASAWGLLLSLLAMASITGALMPTLIGRQRRSGIAMLLIAGALGSCMMAIGFVRQFVPMAAILVAMGMGSGWMTVIAQSWLQANIDPAMRARTMSVMAFASLGLLPLSHGLMGALIRVDLAWTFAACGATVVAVAAVSASSRAMREM